MPSVRAPPMALRETEATSVGATGVDVFASVPQLAPSAALWPSRESARGPSRGGAGPSLPPSVAPEPPDPVPAAPPALPPPPPAPAAEPPPAAPAPPWPAAPVAPADDPPEPPPAAPPASLAEGPDDPQPRASNTGTTQANDRGLSFMVPSRALRDSRGRRHAEAGPIVTSSFDAGDGALVVARAGVAHAARARVAGEIRRADDARRARLGRAAVGAAAREALRALLVPRASRGALLLAVTGAGGGLADREGIAG